MFMGTLQGPYLDRLIGSTSANFSDLVVAGERIENGLKTGKTQGPIVASNGTKKPYGGFPKKKEGETNAASTSKGKGRAYPTPYYQVVGVTPNNYQPQTYAIPAIFHSKSRINYLSSTSSRTNPGRTIINNINQANNIPEDKRGDSTLFP